MAANHCSSMHVGMSKQPKQATGSILVTTTTPLLLLLLLF